MPIETPAQASPAERLYNAIGAEVRGLPVLSRMALIEAIKRADGYRTLRPDLRAAFERVAAKLQLALMQALGSSR